ncbi:MAG: RNase adapter RapZ [Pseudomonadota bacterium]
MTDRTPEPLPVLLVTGPSGAGRTTAINALEDMGYEVINNLPLSLLPRLLDGAPLDRPLALGLDVRNRDFSAQSLVETVDTLTSDPRFRAELLFLDCSPKVLVRRYSETRRRHPLAPDAAPSLGIDREIELLRPIRERAEVLIDTTELTPRDLSREVSRWFSLGESRTMSVSVHSFSYKRGIPHGVDMVIDCRFLRNPHWEQALRALDGTDQAVAEYVSADPSFAEFFRRVTELVETLLPAYMTEGKTHFALAFGCTGGQHRSVFVTEQVAKVIAETGWQVSKRHRELERRAGVSSAAGKGEDG